MKSIERDVKCPIDSAAIFAQCLTMRDNGKKHPAGPSGARNTTTPAGQPPRIPRRDSFDNLLRLFTVVPVVRGGFIANHRLALQLCEFVGDANHGAEQPVGRQ